MNQKKRKKEKARKETFSGAIFPLTLTSGLYNSLYYRTSRDYIGNEPIDIDGNNLIVGDKEYEGTPGLWELIISKQLDNDIYTVTDFDNYTKILLETSALKQNNHPGKNQTKVQ